MDANEKNAQESIPLQIQGATLDEIVEALLAGQVVQIAEERTFSLSSEDSRKLLSYYSKKRDLWLQSRRVEGKEISDLLTAIEAEAPILQGRKLLPRINLPMWTLVRVEAHRFGGLHHHCDLDGKAPDLFELDLESDVTLIGGFNGAGKTALQSAIVWCLTNRALRSQHLPYEIHEPMTIWEVIDGNDEEPQELRDGPPIPPIVPIPTAKELEVLKDKPILDTRVTLTFRNDETGDTCEVVRSLVPVGRGRTQVECLNLEKLGLPPLAIEVGTLMPGIASHMRFDEKTTFAQAVAHLTGLKPLEELGIRTQRTIKRIESEEIPEQQRLNARKRTEYSIKKQEILVGWNELTDLGAPEKILDPGDRDQTETCESSITRGRSKLEAAQKRFRDVSEEILGNDLRLSSDAEVKKIREILSDARECMAGRALQSLTGLNVIRELDQITDEDKEAAKALIEEYRTRAEEVALRLKDVEKSARWQLYTTVAAWHKEHHSDTDFTNCPVCGTNLEKVPEDARLDIRVSDALTKSLQANADTAKSAKLWEAESAREFLDRLPKSLKSLADAPLPITLTSAYQKAYVDELLGQSTFDSNLKPLRRSALAVWQVAAALSPLVEIVTKIETNLPSELSKGALAVRFGNVVKAISLANSKIGSGDRIAALLIRYLGKVDDASVTEYLTTPKDVPLRIQIEILRRNVESTAPIVSLLAQLGKLDTLRIEWEKGEARLALLSRTANALSPLLSFPNIVHEKVSGLIHSLGAETQSWIDRLYRAHYVGGPKYGGIDPAVDKGIGIRATIGSLQVPAHQVMNTSQLRACVWAFLFSLLAQVRKNIGGIDCVLLDDPQTHFDPINAEHFAAAIPHMPTTGIRPIVTSNDGRFLAAIRAKLPDHSSGTPSWRAWRLNPISSSKMTASLSPMIEELYERRDEWRKDENNVTKAQAYVERVRSYLESRLWDILASDPKVMHKPTLADLLNGLSQAQRNGEKPFEEPPFEKLLSLTCLRSTSTFYSVINKAHHRINEVTPGDAEEVERYFNEVDRLLTSCLASYARFMGRLTREDETLLFASLPEAPQLLVLPNVLPYLGSISARSSANPLVRGIVAESLIFSELGGVAFYGIRGASLGTIALQGQIVMVCPEAEAKDGDPVICLNNGRTYARRLCLDSKDPSRITLVADRSGSDNVAPSISLAKSQSRVMPIVGILYDSVTSLVGGEAVEVESSQILGRKLCAAKVVDDSAYPIIRRGDFVLVEDVEMAVADFDQLEGEIVAFSAKDLGGDDRFAYLKRVGTEIRPGLRIFDNVGSTGSAMPVFTIDESEEGRSAGVVLDKSWRVHGVLRRSISIHNS